jgi:hypothetical protein
MCKGDHGDGLPAGANHYFPGHRTLPNLRSLLLKIIPRSITIQVSRLSIWELKIAGITGQVFYQSLLINENTRIDISMLPEGMYTMIFSRGDEMLCKKLIKF